jgi:hypothetical protein
MKLKRILTPLLIGFIIMGLILLASLIVVQLQLPRVMRTINNTIIISVGNSTMTVAIQSNQTAPVNNTHA